jgi:hypothetical protein
MAKKVTLETKTIDGFEITDEREEGQVFAVGYCPQCGQREESIQLGYDPGKSQSGN